MRCPKQFGLLVLIESFWDRQDSVILQEKEWMNPVFYNRSRDSIPVGLYGLMSQRWSGDDGAMISHRSALIGGMHYPHGTKRSFAQGFSRFWEIESSFLVISVGVVICNGLGDETGSQV